MIKSPLNYIGGKYKLLPQLLDLFPANIDHYVDLFAGGLDVAVNVEAVHKECNDINYRLIDIYRAMQQMTIEDLLDYMDRRIVQYGLSKTNKQGYLQLRDDYNRNPNPLDLYVLVCYSFNYQFRFNSKMEYNNPFGTNRSSFSEVMRQHLIDFHPCITHITFHACHFCDYDLHTLGPNDFLYADPPYLISCGSYNDGKRGFRGWTAHDDLQLFLMLDELHHQGSRFALSNVFTHKGQENRPLIDWARHYHVHYINHNYNNSNYQSRSRANETQEVLVTNY